MSQPKIEKIGRFKMNVFPYIYFLVIFPCYLLLQNIYSIIREPFDSTKQNDNKKKTISNGSFLSKISLSFFCLLKTVT